MSFASNLHLHFLAVGLILCPYIYIEFGLVSKEEIFQVVGNSLSYVIEAMTRIKLDLMRQSLVGLFPNTIELIYLWALRFGLK